MLERFLRLRPEQKMEVSTEEFVADKSERVMTAVWLAIQVHEGDFRKGTGEPYSTHCLAVANILDRWGADEDEIIAGLLHDTYEDHPDRLSLDQIEDVYGERVANLVAGVTKLKSREGERNEFETLRKVTRESYIEPGVALVKLADRLHNMTSLECLPIDRQRVKAEETISVYVPLAESLGLWQVKNALADLAFRYLEQNRFNSVREIIDRDPRLTVDFIQSMEGELGRIILGAGIKARIEHQVGGYWELAEKQKRSSMRADSRPKSFADITDVVSFRVVVEDDDQLDECYRAMGLVRLAFADRLVQNRHDDYLVIPSINGYSAIHDTFKFREGNVEVAFTTDEKEKFNNWGVASVSKEELRRDPDRFRRKLIFTPKQELAIMNVDAKGIDVAYRLNPLLGLKAVAIKIDGKVMPLDTVVPNAAMVEIITEQHQEQPDMEWLNYCGNEATAIIEQQLRIVEHDREVERGRKKLVEELLHERGILDLSDLDLDTVNRILMDLGCWYGTADLYYKTAFGLDLSLVARKLDENMIKRGTYTTILVRGSNSIGVSEEISRIIKQNGGDARSKVERVDQNENFMVRVLITVGYAGKKKIEEELKEKYPECVVV